MNRNDINRIYTDTVAGLLAKGYQIHTETMNSLQGEIAHIDLSNGSEILRVLIEENCDYRESYRDILSIRVGRCTDHIGDGRNTIWNHSLETLSEIRLAKVSENFYTDIESGRRMADVRLARWQRRNDGHSSDRRMLGDAYKSVALRWLRRQPRMKSCLPEDITGMQRIRTRDGAVCYEIVARGKTYRLQK